MAWLKNFLIDVLRWWKFRRVRLQAEGRGCKYKYFSSNFISGQYIALGDFVHIGPGAMIDAAGGVEIGVGSILAPEVWIYSRTHHFGEAAAAHSKALLEGKNVRLEPDPTNSDRDKYRRLLRYVYLPDGTLVNARLIADGYAFAYTIFPFTRLDEFRGLESEARTANRGLWAGCNVDDSKDIKQTTGPKG